MNSSSRFGVVTIVVIATATAGAISGMGTVEAQSQGSHVVVQSATVEPENPQVGEPVTITATIANFASSPGGAQINEVWLRSNGIADSVDDLGTLGTDGTMEVPLTTSFESAGQKRVIVHVNGRSENGAGFYIRYPVTVTVEESNEDVQLSLSTPDDPATETPVNVTVGNGAATNVSNLQLELAGPNATVDDPRRVLPSIESGHERTIAYDVTFDRVGHHSITATLTYRNTDGDRRTVTETRSLDVAPADVDVELDTEVVRNGSDARVDATVTNFGNVPLTDIRIRAEANNDTVARTFVPDVGIESSQTVSISESNLPAGDIQLVAGYEAAGERYETARTVDFTPTAHGNITLTGIEVTGVGRSVTLTGSASNIGETDVTGAVVEVVDTDDVTPISPTRDYFIGNVPAGEFTSFELTARTASNRTDAIPVRVTYIADGEQRTRVEEVVISDARVGPASGNGPSSDGSDTSGGLFPPLGQLISLLLQLAVLVVLVGGAVYWWRNRSDDEET